MIRPLAALAILALAVPGTGAAESPKWGTIELSLGSFKPAIDQEFDGAETPWRDIFGDKGALFPRARASFTLLDRFVQLDVGVGTGWFRQSKFGLFDSGLPSEDRTAFTVIPSSLALTLRADGFAERWPVPLELYGRAVLERYNWFITDGSGKMVEKGATNGWSVAAGVGFLLDFIDPGLSRELDEETGINATWLFVEVEKAWVDDFGSSRSWILADGALTFAGGLRMVF